MSGGHCCTEGVESVMRSKSRGFIYSYFILSMERLYSEPKLVDLSGFEYVLFTSACCRDE